MEKTYLSLSKVSVVFCFFIIKGVLTSSNVCIDHGYTPENGWRSPATHGDFYEGAVVRYYCNENYKLQPDEPVQTCKLNSTGHYVSWVPSSAPTCVKKATCAPPDVGHGYTSNLTYYEGQYLEVICDDGYEFTEQNESICLSTGNWSQAVSCTEKSCREPPDVAHASYTYSSMWLQENWSPGSSVLLSCDDGYTFDTDYDTYLLTCKQGDWTGSHPECVPAGCKPPPSSEGTFYIPDKNIYDVGEQVRYYCANENVSPPGYEVLVCGGDHKWSGEVPTCRETSTSAQMPYTTNGNVFCTRPLPISHGKVLCCVDEEETTSNITDDVTYCCPINGFVQFVCDVGYAVKDESTQWQCGAQGQWVLIDFPQYGVPPTSPSCQSNITKTDQNEFTDDMLKPVLGTAAGVLLILSVAIIVAFCRPKLKDIKRRWREMREDEEELIIDGRRILLPSYEEAVGNPNDPYLQLAGTSNSSFHDDMPGPSYTSRGPENRQGTQDGDSSRDDVSCILQIHSESSRNRLHLSTSSDEEILIPPAENDSREMNDITINIDKCAKVRTPPRSPLILRAGSSANSSILINKVPHETEFANETTNGTSNILHMDSCSNDKENNKTLPISENVRISMDSIRENPCKDRESESVFLNSDSASNSDTGLDLIRPQNLLQPKVKERQSSVASLEVRNLENYPLNIEQDDTDPSHQKEQTYTIDLETESRDSSEDSIQNSTIPEEMDTSTECEIESSPPKQESDQDDVPRVSIPSDHVHLVTSSHSSVCQLPDDLTSSTTV